MSGAAAGGAVYDRGYRPYDGARGGRESARWALVRTSQHSSGTAHYGWP